MARSAAYYDAVHRKKDYDAQSRSLKDIIQHKITADSPALLDVGCATGEHLLRFEGFALTGLDHDADLLRIAASKQPHVDFIRSDIESFRLEQRFDVILCLGGATAYASGVDELRLIYANFLRHLKPGGLCLVEPFLRPDSAHPGRPYAVFVDEADLKLARMSDSSVAENRLRVIFHYLIGENARIEHFTETHYLQLFTQEEHLEALAAAGFTAMESLALPEFPRGLYVARVSG